MPQYAVCGFRRIFSKSRKNIQKVRKKKRPTQENMDEGDYAVPEITLQDIEAARANITANSIFKLTKRLKVKPKDLLDI
ncbi:transcriptional regulator [Leptospira kmetyi]|nr:transcriptional regulator [Leptospira kmetyi]TGL69741.1 transcriptional regulator [Leptospira kmetyi]